MLKFYAWAVFLYGWARMGWIDWNEQRIRHRYMVTAGALTAAGLAWLLAWSALGAGADAAWWTAFAWHLAASAAAAFLLWSLRVWPAGDTKLFFLLAFLSPIMRAPGSFRGSALFLENLINTFVPAAAYLFLAALAYLWSTRFASQAAFLKQLGSHRAPGYVWLKTREGAAAIAAELKGWGLEARDRPGSFLVGVASWIAQMCVMSLVSYALADRISSTFVRTLVCFALFFGWSRFAASLGRTRALLLTAASFAALIAWKGRVDWAGLTFAFGHISIFSLCLFFGVQIAFRAVAGQSAFLLLPFLFLIPTLIPFGKIWGALAGLSGPLATWALMGTLFGLAIVFVRMWDSESYESVRPDQIKPYMNLGPGLVAAIETDADFREEFGSFYADGLTPRQAAALREWCDDNEVASVPLAPTISFANWIYLGYFLTVVLQGHVLRRLY